MKEQALPRFEGDEPEAAAQFRDDADKPLDGGVRSVPAERANCNSARAALVRADAELYSRAYPAIPNSRFAKPLAQLKENMPSVSGNETEVFANAADTPLPQDRRFGTLASWPTRNQRLALVILTDIRHGTLRLLRWKLSVLCRIPARQAVQRLHGSQKVRSGQPFKVGSD
jgi:hypothetical protein